MLVVIVILLIPALSKVEVAEVVAVIMEVQVLQVERQEHILETGEIMDLLAEQVQHSIDQVAVAALVVIPTELAAQELPMD
jgi:hypothetical protein